MNFVGNELGLVIFPSELCSSRVSWPTYVKEWNFTNVAHFPANWYFI